MTSPEPKPIPAPPGPGLSQPWDPAAPTNAFERGAGEYTQFRPSYPDEAVATVLGNDFEPGQWVADVGAGTGILTAQLLARGARVRAVEPAAAMRQQFETSLAAPLARGEVELLAGSAEHTQIAAQSVRLVAYAQCWHWLDQPRAMVEAARILESDGRVAIVANQMEVEVPWVHRLTRIMRSGDVYRAEKPPQLGERFTAPDLHVSHFTTRLRPDAVMALARTRSSYLRSNAANRVKMQDNLRWYLRDYLGYGDEDVVEIPYLTLTWTARLR